MDFLRGKRLCFGGQNPVNKDPPLSNSGRFSGVNKDPPPNSESGKTLVNKDPPVKGGVFIFNRAVSLFGKPFPCVRSPR